MLAAAVTQVLALNFADREVREGALGFLALGWTYLYAIAVGAGAFAGEREASTLRLLDILPADRRIVWAGKVSFAYMTTLALALVLLTMAAVGTGGWVGPSGESSLRALVNLGPAVLAALGWGLLCSALSSNAVVAAVAAVCLAGISGWPAVGGRLVVLYEARLAPVPSATNCCRGSLASQLFPWSPRIGSSPGSPASGGRDCGWGFSRPSC